MIRRSEASEPKYWPNALALLLKTVQIAVRPSGAVGATDSQAASAAPRELAG